MVVLNWGSLQNILLVEYERQTLKNNNFVKVINKNIFNTFGRKCLQTFDKAINVDTQSKTFIVLTPDPTTFLS